MEKSKKEFVGGQKADWLMDAKKPSVQSSMLRRKNVIAIKINVARSTPVCADYQFEIVSQSVLNRSINNMMLYQQFDFDALHTFFASQLTPSSQLQNSQIQNEKKIQQSKSNGYIDSLSFFSLRAHPFNMTFHVTWDWNIYRERDSLDDGVMWLCVVKRVCTHVV